MNISISCKEDTVYDKCVMVSASRSQALQQPRLLFWTVVKDASQVYSYFCRRLYIK